ncbi:MULTISPECIES: NAD(P)/FAD-dependent oxidoreductase [Streptomyces]|uniref:NAD(P)/FAD-dependent oxidoreductase n=1 Tax=Streptomyces TaxID=1883 RepID=UPI001291A417|nr:MULTISPECIES: FAD-dependent monooxygenase [Streptomyces]MCX5040571.1 FAD-dependent monooxygenase [Streptomyces coelicoflavus]QFX80533.1 pyridine nucleotide-disulfide oxidoreductase [Streptomyces sp. SYP-A7193]
MAEGIVTRRPTAVVIGAGATGLLAAAALADFADVTVVERDRLPEGPEPRRGVPQARHAHLVWSGGVRAFDDLLPGLTGEIVADGGRLVHIMGDMVSRASNEVWFRRFTATHHRNLVCSRDLLDSVLRNRVLADARVMLRQETTVLRLEGDAAAVTGVRVRAGGEEGTLRADLIVDASGRGSRAPQWLTALGAPRVTEREVNAGLVYATRLYRAPVATRDTDFPLVNVQANPAKPPGRGGIILPIEGNRWIVTLAGTRGGEPTDDPGAFVDFALNLGDPVIGELVKDLEPLGGITTTRATANRRRYYEHVKRWPDGFLVLGDAIAGYNPVYGHGLTVAAQCALAVRDTLDATGCGRPGLTRRLQRAAARPVAAAWDLAVGQDALYPGATDTRPNSVERLLARFVDKAVETGARNPRAMAALLDVMSLERPATRLFSPDMLIPMLIGPKRPHLQGPPLSDAERKSAVP